MRRRAIPTNAAKRVGQAFLLAALVAILAFMAPPLFRQQKGDSPTVTEIMNKRAREATAIVPIVRYVLPDRFRGPIRISTDPNAPPAERSEIKTSATTFTLRIPDTGNLKVESLDFMYTGHRAEAVFANGKSLPIDDMSGALTFIHGGVTSTNQPDEEGRTEWHGYFVGTWKEAFDEEGIRTSPSAWQAKTKPKN